MKLNWTRGKSLGLALAYLGVMGLIQVLFMLIAQYGMLIGSKATIIIIPIGCILATFYSVLMLFESNTSVIQYHNVHNYKKRSSRKRAKKRKVMDYLSDFWNNNYVQPVLIVTIIFSVIFGLAYLVFQVLIDRPSTIFVLADNIAAWACLLYANYKEGAASRKTR